MQYRVVHPCELAFLVQVKLVDSLQGRTGYKLTIGDCMVKLAGERTAHRAIKKRRL